MASRLSWSPGDVPESDFVRREKYSMDAKMHEVARKRPHPRKGIGIAYLRRRRDSPRAAKAFFLPQRSLAKPMMILNRCILGRHEIRSRSSLEEFTTLRKHGFAFRKDRIAAAGND